MRFRGTWIKTQTGKDLGGLAMKCSKRPVNSLSRLAFDPPRRCRKILQRFFARYASSATPGKLLSCCSRAAAPHYEPVDRTWAGTWTGGLGPPTAASHQGVRMDENDCGWHRLQERCFHISALKTTSLQPCGRLLLKKTCCPLQEDQLRLTTWLTARWLAERI